MSSATKLYTIPSEIPFLAALAEGIIARHFDAKDPASLAQLTVLLPTRRAARSLSTRLLDHLGADGAAAALILPNIRPLGDVDEDALILAEDESGFEDDGQVPETLPPLRRRLLLMQLVDRWGKARSATGADPLSAAQSLHLARELERLIDHAEAEGARLDQLARLAPAELSAHWVEILGFLDIVGTQWPHIEAEAGAIGPARRRALLMDAQRQRWLKKSPGPVIAAGSTGTIPATAALLKTIADLPEGAVILPGLDQILDEESWRAIGPSHPQGAMKALLERMEIPRDAVARWPFGKPTAPAIRTHLLNEALRPWSETGRWQLVTPVLRKEIEENRDSLRLHCIEAAHEGEEARTIALVLREALEVPDRRAALVTRERRLARAVQAELRRWDIEIDDSAGLPLALTPPGVFLRLLLAAARGALDPVSLLALLKHPLTRAGFPPDELPHAIAALERNLLRGPRPAPGFLGLYAALHMKKEGPEIALIRTLVDRLSAAIGTFTSHFEDASEKPFGTLLAAQLGAAEALAGSDALWQGESGEAVSLMLTEILAEEHLLPKRPPADYPGFFETLLAGPVARPAFGRHPRLFIWGPLEARLQEADVLILGGLNEGSSPAEPAGDPWMSRSMAEAAGLPPPEQRLGLAAHDFVQSAGCAHTVYLTRAIKRDGAPTIASRWLTRLEALLTGAGKVEIINPPAPWLSYARALDAPPARTPSARQPRPTPPREARPRTLSVTEIESWVRDPYAIYAKHVLGVIPLSPLDQEADAALRGRMVHQIVEILARATFDPDAADALPALLAHGRSIFDANRLGADLRALWWPRFEESARWLLDSERERRAAGETLLAAERKGKLEFEAPGGLFTLRARADRIDRARDGTLIIADYKTGQPPTEKEMRSGLAPQLPLEAMIAAEGGFDDVAPAQVSLLRVIRLMTKRDGGEVHDIEDALVLAARVFGSLRELVSRYDDATYPYRARLIPKFIGPLGKAEGPYDHLARVKEWAQFEEEDEA